MFFNLKKALFSAALVIGSSAAVAQESPRTAFVHLFEWKWSDIATECETFLGPKGFAAVQISPPQESSPGPEWWRRYQPISYEITGRSGNRAAFKNMVDRCGAVGVDIYADLVINHMAGNGRNHPKVPYGVNDFNVHFCGSRGINYRIREEVQSCDLLGLDDLRTSSNYVQQTIANYANDLTSLGVKGFRIDAAKHIPASDLGAITARFTGNPYIFNEVIGAPNEPITTGEYVGIGDVTEFAFSKFLGSRFKSGQNMQDLRNIGSFNGWLASIDAVNFVSNHDEQRFEADQVVTFKDVSGINYIAEIFTLAYPYGYPKVMSSYKFDTFNQGPPSNGVHSGDTCFSGGWVCEHRWRGIANMVGFRNATASEFRLTNWWDNSRDQIAFGRGGKGFVAINRNGNNTLNRTFSTGMPAGEYCDVIAGNYDKDAGTCSGRTIVVDGSGNAQITVGAIDAAAIHVEAKLGGGPICTTNCGWEQAYFRGTANGWDLTPMTRENGLWVTEQVFGDGDQNGPARFKVTRFANWSVSEPLRDVVVSEGPGRYKVTFNDVSKDFSVMKLEDGGTADVTFSCRNGRTRFGQSVYVVGNLEELGNWNPAQAVKLEPSSYPTWTGSITLPNATAFEWKCIKRSERNPSQATWQRGADNEGFSSQNLSVEASL